MNQPGLYVGSLSPTCTPSATAPVLCKVWSANWDEFASWSVTGSQANYRNQEKVPQHFDRVILCLPNLRVEKKLACILHVFCFIFLDIHFYCVL